jgi:DNA-binding transcriptional ArsR family regulator
MRDLADTFKALSDETRLRIMTLLLDNEELCVCDFVGALDLTQSKASRHLRYLFNAGLTPQQKVLIEVLDKAVGAGQREQLRQQLSRWKAQKDLAACSS